MSLCLACHQPWDGPELHCASCRAGEAPELEKAGKIPEVVQKTGSKKSEAEIRQEIRAFYELQGAWVGDYEQGYRPDACPSCGARLTHSTRVPLGTPDLLVLWPGRGQRWIECKSASGKQTDAQRQFQERARAAGAIYWLARSVEEVMQLEASERSEP